MSVVIYVDELVPVKRLTTKWPYRSACHMSVCPPTPEAVSFLHEFAKAIGLRRAWFQDDSWPHYDLTATKRYDAMRLGAVEITCETFAEMRLRYRNAGVCK